MEDRPRERERDDLDKRDDRDRSQRRREDGDRERRRRSRSRSRDRRRRSRSRSRDRRRSRSRSRDRRRSSRDRSAEHDPEKSRRRPTWFDIPPIGGVPPPLTQLPGAVQVFSVPGGGGGGGGMATGGGPMVSMATGGGGASAAMSQQATRHARRIYVGGLPPSANEQNVQTFFSNALAAVGGTTAGPGLSVVNVYVNFEKKFAFVEFRTVEEASNAMALDGIMFEGVTVRIRRPADYQAAAAASLGPSMPNPNLNLAAIGLDRPAMAAVPAVVPNAAAVLAEMGIPPGGFPAPDAAAAPGAPAMPGLTSGQAVHQMHVSGPDASERVFIGGLPYYLEEAQVRELLAAFGEIKTFELIRDRATGQSKGYGFCVFVDPRVTDVATSGLHGMQMGDRALTCRRAHTGQQRAEMGLAPVGAAAGMPPPVFGGQQARVVKLTHAVTMEELQHPDEVRDILEDMQEECGKYGTVVQVHIPQPAGEGAPRPPGLGKVIIEFKEPSAAMAARNAMHGRKFAGRVVEAVLMTEADYNALNWD